MDPTASVPSLPKQMKNKCTKTPVGDLPFLKSTGAHITHLVMHIASKPTCDTSGAKDALAHKPVKAIQNKPAEDDCRHLQA